MMIQPSVVIFGVGRSGTTALFDDLVKAYTLLQCAPSIRYEPFLWDVRHGALEDVFNRTNALSPEGIAAHRAVPMFLQNAQEPRLDDFVYHLSVSETPFLIKFIRTCGRIEFFLHKWPKARFIFIFRDPCSVVNSASRMFTFFGDEYHPSDESRFAVETGVSQEHFQTLSYVVKQLTYWREMNEAALASTVRYRDRILPISQEALLLDPRQTMGSVFEFCFGSDAATRLCSDMNLGDRLKTSNVRRYLPSFDNLPVSDYDRFKNELDWYVSTLLPSCKSGVRINRSNLRNVIVSGWIRGQIKRSGSGTAEGDHLEVPRDRLGLRQMLKEALSQRAAIERALISEQDSKRILAQINDRNLEQLQDMKAQLQDMKAQLQDRKAQLQDRKAQLQDRKAQLQDATQKLQAVYASRSWRVTAPLRLIMRTLRHARHGHGGNGVNDRKER